MNFEMRLTVYTKDPYENEKKKNTGKYSKRAKSKSQESVESVAPVDNWITFREYLKEIIKDTVKCHDSNLGALFHTSCSWYAYVSNN